MKILIGYDGSSYADAAIHDLSRAGLPPACESIIWSSADLDVDLPFAGYESPNSPYRSVPAEVVEQARAAAASKMQQTHDIARRGAELVGTICPRWNLTSGADAKSAPWSLIRKAEHWGADLLVVGSHGRSLLGRLAMGSVSQGVVHYAHCSVRVGRSQPAAPEADKRKNPIRVVLAIDGSVDAAVAVEAVRSRAWPVGTEIHVITALDLRLVLQDIEGWSAAGPDDRSMTIVAKRRVDRVTRELREQGIAAEPFVLEGDPKHVLLEHAERWTADCIFVGARGHTMRERFLMGSVSAAVAARAHCSVEIVRRSA